MKQEKQNPFIKYNGIKDAKVHIHKTSGLYDASNEHDACGVGMIVDIHGNKSHELVDSALKVLENMKHRGAEGADNKTGDGAGIMLQIPHEFILLQGIPVPEKGKYGTGLVFLPKDEQEQSHMLSVMIEEIEREGLNLMHLRNVPVNSSILGKDASATEPSIKQIFITGSTDTENLERTLYIIRKRIENRIHHKDFYIVSLSSKNIVYKGMLSSVQVREYFPDLTQPYFTSGLAVVHSRFSTNTFPTWSLAQPFRLLAHNGEINTIRGNRAWMEARESVLSTPTLGNVKQIRPIIQPGMSDSASLDNVLEFFVMSGLSLPHAMAMLVPESFNDKNPISEDLKAFYEYHSILMEPWDGPAALLFSDGRYAGGMLDRNGLRPARYLITRNDMMVVASEAGTIHFEPGDIKEKGRLQPGKILLVDTQEGKIYYDGELKAQLAAAKPYRQWLSTNRIELDTLRSGRKVEDVTLIAVSKTKPVPMLQEAYDAGARDFGENKVQEILEKEPQLPSDIRWHMIGHLQKNKVRQVIDKAVLIHSVDTVGLAEQIEKEAVKRDLDVSILLEVNVAGEESKFGFAPEEVEKAAREIAKYPHVHIQGLMTIAPFVENSEENRGVFKKLYELYVDMKRKNIDNVTMNVLPHRSNRHHSL